jgi:hypothetical protein
MSHCAEFQIIGRIGQIQELMHALAKAIRLIEDILVVSEQVCRVSFPVRPDCDLEAPGIFVARLGDVKNHWARPLALCWARCISVKTPPRVLYNSALSGVLVRSSIPSTYPTPLPSVSWWRRISDFALLSR